MTGTSQREVILFTVRRAPSGNWDVSEQGFEKSIAAFEDCETAEQYALRLAESKTNWQVEVYDASNTLIGTYNSEDDSMPKPVVR